MSHAEHELPYCLRGSFEYGVEGTVYQREAGDSLLFEASLTHHWHNRGTAPASFLLVFEAAGADLVRKHLQL
jgi:quercetin dioxygenase-like cupin family protein